TVIPAFFRSLTSSPCVVLGGFLTVLQIIFAPRDELSRAPILVGQLAQLVAAKSFLPLCVYILTDSCCNSTTQIKADGEGSVSIRCPYESENEDSLKYICRGKQPSTCLQRALITSSRQSGRFSFTDDKKSRTFTITIYNLTLEDSGSYLCGVQSDSGLDDFSAVELEVKEWCCVIPKNMTGVVGQSVTVQCPYPPEDHNNRKFICKGNKHDCRDVMMMMMMMSQNRFMLHDESSSSFSVTITNLEASDTGTFWCRSDSEWRVGNYTQFHLSVGESSSGAH
ncbi:polymeric immunoglobulin receptor-like, partial [Nothobranchius furzeri]